MTAQPIIPVLSMIEARWKPEIVQRPDVLEVSGKMRDVTRRVILQQELRIRFDWFEVGGSEPLFFREFEWTAAKQPANEVFNERVAASELLKPGSTFAIIAAKLLEMAPELLPAESSPAFALPTYVTEQPVGRLRVYLPYADRMAAERMVEIDVHHYLDKECKQVAFKKTKQWLSRAVLMQRELDETSAEALLNTEEVEPLLMDTIRECAELVQGIYPTFAIDIDQWIQLAGGVIDAFSEPVA